MRSVGVQQNPGLVVMVMRIAANVRSFVYDQTCRTALAGQTLGENCAGVTRAHDQVVPSDRRIPSG